MGMEQTLRDFEEADQTPKYEQQEEEEEDYTVVNGCIVEI